MPEAIYTRFLKNQWGLASKHKLMKKGTLCAFPIQSLFWKKGLPECASKELEIIPEFKKFLLYLYFLIRGIPRGEIKGFLNSYHPIFFNDIEFSNFTMILTLLNGFKDT